MDVSNGPSIWCALCVSEWVPLQGQYSIHVTVNVQRICRQRCCSQRRTDYCHSNTVQINHIINWKNYWIVNRCQRSFFLCASFSLVCISFATAEWLIKKSSPLFRGIRLQMTQLIIESNGKVWRKLNKNNNKRCEIINGASVSQIVKRQKIFWFTF